MDSSPHRGRNSDSQTSLAPPAGKSERPRLVAAKRGPANVAVSPSVPVFPFRYFRTAIEALKSAGAMPHEIDRSVWANKHFGITDDDLLPAFRFLGLIDETRRPLPLLGDLVGAFATPQWPQQLERMLRGAYGDVLSIGIDQASPKHILEIFRKRFGLEPARARISAGFFVHAARESQLNVGPFLASPRLAPVSPKAQASRERVARLMLSRLPVFDNEWSDDLKLAWLATFKEVASSQ